jgi:hypothetical protein
MLLTVTKQTTAVEEEDSAVRKFPRQEFILIRAILLHYIYLVKFQTYLRNTLLAVSQEIKNKAWHQHMNQM